MKRFLIAVIDYSNCKPVAWAFTKHKAKEVARLISLKIISFFGKPKRPIIDGVFEVVSNYINAYCVRNLIDRIITTPYHSQANRRVKIMNVTLVQLLSSMTQDKPKQKWDQHLSAVLLALRAQIKHGMRFSPVTPVFKEPVPL